MSKALNSSISSIFSRSDFLDLQYFSRASGEKEIMDKCFLIFLFLFLNSYGTFALDKYKISFFLLDTIFTKLVLLLLGTFKLGIITSAEEFLI